ncbi:MAG: M60 family metallopeptidase [Bacteroidaceae bacterium]|nr:M60 family metallopeptidase [Bacteroidaceae bacterium]
MKQFYSVCMLLIAMLCGSITPVSASSTSAMAGDAGTTMLEFFDSINAKGGLIRIKNKRTSTAYLTSRTAGAAIGASKVKTGYSQIWIWERSGSGYSLRNANTGEYLQAAFATPGSSASVLFVQFSPNNTGTQSYVNISSAEDFSGLTCLNLGNNGSTLNKWSYSGDSGSDWLIELAEDVTVDEIKQHFNSQKGYANEIKSGSYYRLISTAYTLYATDDNGIVKSIPLASDNLSQCWQITTSGTGYTLKNVVTEKYIETQTTTSRPYTTGSTQSVFYIKPVEDKWEYKWTIGNTSSASSQGLHTASSQSNQVVNWYINADASIWALEEVELTDEEIAAARQPYLDYQDLVSNLSTYQAHISNLFADKACTELKPEIAALSNEALAANEDFAALNKDMKAMVLKIKDNTWQQFTNETTGYTADFERFFRIADYKIYSHYIDMSNGSNFTMSNYFGKLSGPTGIVANAGEIVYIYVGESPKAKCTLQLEAVDAALTGGNSRTGATTDLKAGLNVFTFSQQKMLYIFYQLNDTKLYLADYPDIKIHIEGGQLNGYWDATRGMTNDDWKLLCQQLLKAPMLNLKTKHLVFQVDAEKVKSTEPDEMEGLMRVWDMIPENEENYMGVEDFEGRFRNIWNVFSIFGGDSYMYATTYGTYYQTYTLDAIMNYKNFTTQGEKNNGGALWGPSHEMGHNHQASINVVGTTESSNNAFSNINMFEQGISTTRGASFTECMAGLLDNTPWNGRDIWVSTRMFFQLYLYFHVQGHDPQFYPNLFRALRKTPINKGTWDGTLGGYKTNGGLDYLRLATTICDVAQADLSEFFEAYGMFVPVTNYEVGDYSTYYVTTTQQVINNAKKKMQKYPKKLGNIMFIDDRIVKKSAIKDNKFEGQPASSGYRVNCSFTVGSEGTMGDYETFTSDPTYMVSNCFFTISGTTITFKGTGMVGYKFYDLDGNLLWATNKTSTTLPTKLVELGPERFRVVAAEANMNDVPCPYYNVAKSKNYSATVYFGSSDYSKTWRFNSMINPADFLPENALAVVTTADAPDNITSAANVINNDSTAQSIVINGDQPMYIPVETTAASLSFAKTINGYAALNLPFDVTDADITNLQSASYEDAQLLLVPATRVAAGKPVVVNGNVSLSLTNATLRQGDYREQDNISVLATDGQSVETAEHASAFIFNMANATAIRSIDAANGQAPASVEIYDITGRRVTAPTRTGIYIINNRKTVVNK